ncbi:MAG TPA: hypothetical protein VLB03_09740, partial [Nocardioidaceae bacterium]|nr:hypothetical protein [Nocardioidaceae bacterium]
MFELATPHPRYQPSFLAAADEFLAAGEDRYARIPDIRQDAFFEGLSYTREELEDPAAFAHYAAWLAGQKEPGHDPLRPGSVRLLLAREPGGVVPERGRVLELLTRVGQTLEER